MLVRSVCVRRSDVSISHPHIFICGASGEPRAYKVTKIRRKVWVEIDALLAVDVYIEPVRSACTAVLASVAVDEISTMELFYHNVGMEGADRDFPKTVFSRVALETIESHVSDDLRPTLTGVLRAKFPQGDCNCWGVPEGAKSVIRDLAPGDAVLLIRTIGSDGEIPVLAMVDAFWREAMPELSTALWGSEHFPYVFFFESRKISLNWPNFKDAVGYAPNYRCPAHFLRVKDAESRLQSKGGIPGYLNIIQGKTGAIQNAARVIVAPVPTPDDDYWEGQRLTRERSYFKRNPKLVADAKAHHGTKCMGCQFDFGTRYGEIGEGYIECHHLNPLSEKKDANAELTTTINDVAVLCSNCHRMVHRRRPALSMEELKALLD